MKLSASRFAQWFVQGDYFAIQFDDNQFVVESKKMISTIPFAAWDGQCQLSRGLLWGTVKMEIFSPDESCKTLSVYGLPWLELTAFLYKLTEQYLVWLTKEKQAFVALKPQLDNLAQQIKQHDGYIRQSCLVSWQQHTQSIFAKHPAYWRILLALDPKQGEFFSHWLGQGESMRENYNRQWQEQALVHHALWFDKVQSSPLNASQREAVLLDENYNLVLAGAGSGKTSVLIVKAQYLVTKQQINPSNILMLAFASKAKQELCTKLKAVDLDKVQVATFHSLARQIIEYVTKTPPKISRLVTDDAHKTSWMTLFLTQSFSDPMTQKRWLKHITNWPISGINEKQSLIEQTHDKALHRWLWRVLDLISQQNLSYAMLKQKIKDKNAEQAQSEATLIWPLVRHYRQYLDENKEIDFNGLIHLATQYASKKNLPSIIQIEHILVDEYQDISPARLALLEAICHVKRTRAPSLFAVGDDWQAIYRFAGGDVNLTTDFSKRFYAASVHHLDTTYRFNSNIADVANRFIQVNPNQLKKSLNSVRQIKKNAIHIIDTKQIKEALQTLNQEQKQATVLFIGRNNANRPTDFSAWQKAYPNLSQHYVTAHASKGLEADFSFILDVNEGVFPAKMRDQGLEALLLAKSDEMADSEERRLFYVALTRARHACWICCCFENQSSFVNELSQKGYAVNVQQAKKVLKK